MFEVSSIKGKPEPRLRQAAWAAVLVAAAMSLAGCKGGGLIGSGEGLYHDLQGGRIAEQRPPPPGVNDPFPNLGMIPKRPAAPDIVAQQKLADQLASQRDQAEQSAAASPLTPRPAPPPVPKPPAAPDPNANRVVVDAAPAPVPKPTPAAPPAAATPASVPASPVPGIASVPAVVPAVVSGPLPTLAAAPPPLPVGLDGVNAVAAAAAGSTTVGAAPAPAVPAAAPAPAAPAVATPAKSLFDRLNTPPPIPTGDTIYKPAAIPVVGSVTVGFTPGSAALPPSASLDLRRFALSHKGVPVTITGHGEMVLPGADAQSRALNLALQRAQAIAASLTTAGIPATNLRLHAEAAGKGGTASL